MCYKHEVQRNAAKKLEEKIKEMPEFIKDYFVFFGSNKSKLNYWSAIRQLLEWLIDQNIIKNSINNITPDNLNKVRDVDIVKYLDGLKLGLYGKKISHTTIETKKNIFSGFWSYLFEKELVEKNIITKSVSKKYKVDDSNKEVEVPTDEEVESFIGNLEGIKNVFVAVRNIAIVKLFIGSGLRLEELVGLDVNDLYFENPKNRYVMVMEKGEQNDKKRVDINELAYLALDNYLKMRNMNYSDKEHLWISENGGRLAQISIQNFFKVYSNGNITPHKLRHYNGTKLYENSKHNIGFVQEQLRHKNINTSMKYYVKKDQTAKLEALNSF